MNLSMIAAAKATFLMLGGSLCALSQAQWTATKLHPDGSTNSSANTNVLGVQGGSISTGGVARATLWSDIAGSATSLHPFGADLSGVTSMSGSIQGGFATFGGLSHGGFWTGTFASWTDLHPTGIQESYVAAVSGNRQSGYIIAAPGGPKHAAVWNGTSESWTDLHFSNFEESALTGIYGTQNGGWAVIDGHSHAVLVGLRLSDGYLDLHPSGATDSAVMSVGEDTQAGWLATVTSSGVYRAAARWHYTEGSTLDLNPPGASGSIAYGCVRLGQFWTAEVGSATFGGKEHATIWATNRFIDLHTVLPSGYSQSVAYSVVADGIECYVTGAALNDSTGEYEAFLWQGAAPVPEPGTMAAVAFGVGALALRRRRAKKQGAL